MGCRRAPVLARLAWLPVCTVQRRLQLARAGSSEALPTVCRSPRRRDRRWANTPSPPWKPYRDLPDRAQITHNRVALVTVWASVAQLPPRHRPRRILRDTGDSGCTRTGQLGSAAGRRLGQPRRHTRPRPHRHLLCPSLPDRRSARPGGQAGPTDRLDRLDRQLHRTAPLPRGPGRQRHGRSSTRPPAATTTGTLDAILIAFRRRAPHSVLADWTGDPRNTPSDRTAGRRCGCPFTSRTPADWCRSAPSGGLLRR